MCGIAGLWDQRGGSEDSIRAMARAMTEVLAHRGPDGSGLWSAPESGVVLGHRRLAIQDLSPGGAQPMHSACERYVITYNGEIFNAPELRSNLQNEGLKFRSTSDTEVMLACFTHYGFEAGLQKLLGQFAFALWDRREKSLTLVRDRLGLKPLYFLNRDGLVLFGSELKALMRHPDCPKSVNRQALSSYLRYANVPAPLSILEGISKLQPGHWLRIDADGTTSHNLYWDLAALASKGQQQPLDIGADAAREEADILLREAVSARLLSDVPLGAFLSGGIDSSLVVALMQAQSDQKVRTFSIGFAEADYNEADDAAAVAKHLGTDHTQFILTPGDALEVVPGLAGMYDEPFADSSQIPTHLVSKLARRSVTVALSGDGGDEIAAGYNRHAAIGASWPLLSKIPMSLRAMGAGFIDALPSQAWESASRLLPVQKRPRLPADKAVKFAALLRAGSPEEAWRELVTHWPAPGLLQPGIEEAHLPFDDASTLAKMGNAMGLIQYLDMACYLPDDILCKTDRASMAVALEVRCPLLDHRVVEYFWSLPRDLLTRSGKGKLLLRQILAQYVPSELFERPKMGFGVPIEHWLRGPLREWADDLISEERLKREGYFDPAPIRQAWDEHQAKRANHAYRLWTLLMFQAWHARWLGS